MKIKNALKEFKGFLRRSDHIAAPKSPKVGFAQMLRFYRDVRADDATLAADGDMLLFQWGTYDWGREPHFEIELTRQFIREGGEDEDIWQLRLTYRFNPSETMRELAKGDRWCRLPADLPGLEEFLMSHPAMKAVGCRVDNQNEINFECAG